MLYGLEFKAHTWKFACLRLQFVPAASLLAGLGFHWFLSKKGLKDYIKLLFISILLVLSLFFQIKHFPNYHVDYFLGRIEFSDSKSYQQQIRISNYIQNNTSSEDIVLIWGDEPSLVWLSGRKYSENFRRLHCGLNWTQRYNLPQDHLQKFKNIKLYVFHKQYSTECFNMSFFKSENYRHETIEGLDVFIRSK